MPAAAQPDIFDQVLGDTPSQGDIFDQVLGAAEPPKKYLPEVEKAIKTVPRPDSPLNYAEPGNDVTGAVTGFFPSRTPRTPAKVAPYDVQRAVVGGLTDIASGSGMPGDMGSPPLGEPMAQHVREMETPGKRGTGALGVAATGAEALTPLMGPAALENPASIIRGLAEGTAASKAGGYLLKKAGVSDENVANAETLLFWAPGVARSVLQPKFGAAVSPKEFVIRGGVKVPIVGDVAAEVRIPRSQPPAPAGAIEEPLNTPNAWESAKGNLNPREALTGQTSPPPPSDDPAITSMVASRDAEVASAKQAAGIPPPPPPAPPRIVDQPNAPPELQHGQIPQKLVDSFASVVKALPENLRSQAIQEAHKTLTKVLIEGSQHGPMVGPDGKLIQVDEGSAPKVALKLINDAISAHDKVSAAALGEARSGKAEAVPAQAASAISSEKDKGDIFDQVLGEAEKPSQEAKLEAQGALPRGSGSPAVGTETQSPVGGKEAAQETGTQKNAPVVSAEQPLKKGDQTVLTKDTAVGEKTLPAGSKVTIQYVHPKGMLVRATAEDGTRFSRGMGAFSKGAPNESKAAKTASAVVPKSETTSPAVTVGLPATGKTHPGKLAEPEHPSLELGQHAEHTEMLPTQVVAKYRNSHVQMVPTKELEKYREQDRSIEPRGEKGYLEDLMKELDRDGLKEPLVMKYGIDDRMAHIWDGNHRLNWALDRGIKELPVMVITGKKTDNGYGVSVPGHKGESVPAALKPSEIGLEGRAVKTEGKSEEKATKYKFGNTQAPIHPESEAAKALESARARISDVDLMGQGKEIGDGGNHVTVRYGIQGEDTAGIKKFLSQQAPFEASLGKTEKFPPSEHSDGAAVIQAPIEAPELHRLNAELEKHGDFTEPSFKEYKPHATVAYVNPEKADRYVGMTVTQGKKFTVDRVAITDRNGNAETVKLEGKAHVEKKPEAVPVTAEGVKPVSQAQTGTREKELERQIKDLKEQAAKVSAEFSLSSLHGYDPLSPLRSKYNQLIKEAGEREDELAKLRGEPTRAEKREAAKTASEKKFAERPDKAMKYGDLGQSQHWQVKEPDYIEKRFDQEIARYKRAIPEQEQRIKELGAKVGKQKKALEESTLHFWKKILADTEARDPRKAQKYKEEYRKLVKEAVSHGSPAPQEVIDQLPEFKIAQDARERYEKGLHTSFGNRSAAINDTMQKEEGFKVKRQDGKAITEAQMKEISTGVDEMVKVLGAELRDMMRGTDLTISHTSGKHPFLSDAGGQYHPTDRTISAGINNFLGKPIKALAHELGHWLDFEAGRVLNTKALIRPKSGGLSTETRYISEADRQTKPLYELARRTMADSYRAEKMVKITKLSDLPDEQRQEVEEIKVVLGPYWREPRELWARMFEQYIATKFGGGGVSMQTPTQYQSKPAYWPKEAWVKIEPLFEEALKTRMDAMRERYAPTTIKGESEAEPTPPPTAPESKPVVAEEAKSTNSVMLEAIAKRDRSDWTKLPSDFQRDAVKAAFDDIKKYLPAKDIAARIRASKATTFDELRDAVKPKATIAREDMKARPESLKTAADAGRDAGLARRRGDDSLAQDIMAGNAKYLNGQPEGVRKEILAAFNKAYHEEADKPVTSKALRPPKEKAATVGKATVIQPYDTPELIMEKMKGGGFGNLSGTRLTILEEVSAKQAKEILDTRQQDRPISLSDSELQRLKDKAGVKEPNQEAKAKVAIATGKAEQIEPPEKVPEAGKNFEGRYVRASLEPVKAAWLEKWKPREGEDVDEHWKWMVKNFTPGATDKPAEFSKGHLYIKVPDDGSFYIPNTPSAIDHALKAAGKFESSKVGEALPKVGAKKFRMSSPKEFDNAKYVAGLEKEIADLESEARSETGSKYDFIQEQLKAARENLAEANQPESILTGESGSLEPGKLGEAVTEAAGAVGSYLREAKHATNLARNLQRGLETLDTQKQADILRAAQAMKDLKGQGYSKADDAAIYHHFENPERENLTPEQDRWLDDTILPIADRNSDLYTELTNGGIPIENYVHRVVKGKGGMLDRIAQGVKAIGQKATLSKSAPQTKSRTYMALESQDGERQVVSIKGGQVTAWNHGAAENLGGISHTDEGKVFEDKDGKIWNLKQATTKEIEANTGTVYYHSALASTLASNIQLEAAVRAMRFLEAFKSSPDFKEISFEIGKGNPPKDWKTTNLPQFKGYAFEPRTAEVLDWYYDRMRQGNIGALEQVGQFMRVAMLLNPIMHPMNVAASWAIEKGATGFLMPQNFKTAWKSGNKAVKAVLSQNQDFLDALDAGAPLQSHREAIKDITKLFFDQLGEGLDKEEPWAMKVAKSLGIEHGNLLNLLHKFSSKVAWSSNDIFFLQSAYENQAKNPGLSLTDALKETGRIIPEYRVPTRILDSPAISKLMTNHWATIFGSYHYGLLKSFGEVAKSALGAQEPAPGRTKAEEIAKGWDRLAMIALVTMALYPILDELAKKATGDKHARVRRAGPFGLVDAASQVAKHEQSISTAAQRVVTPAPQTKAAAELAFNREFYAGHQIYDPHATFPVQTEQIGRYLLGEMGQIGQVEKAQTTEQKKRFAWGQAGVQFHKSAAEKTAADIAMSKVGTQAEDPEDQNNRVLRREILEQLRKGNHKPLQEAQAKHEITAKQVKSLEHRARLTPLQDTIHGFSYSEARKVYEVATPEEKKEIDPIMRQKRTNMFKAGRGREITSATQ